MITADSVTDEQIQDLDSRRYHDTIDGDRIGDICIVALSQSHPEMRQRFRARVAEILNAEARS